MRASPAHSRSRGRSRNSFRVQAAASAPPSTRPKLRKLGDSELMVNEICLVRSVRLSILKSRVTDDVLNARARGRLPRHARGSHLRWRFSILSAFDHKNRTRRCTEQCLLPAARQNTNMSSSRPVTTRIGRACPAVTHPALPFPLPQGTMTWGEQNTEAEAHEQLSYACVDRGINFIDTAEMYPVPTKPVRGPDGAMWPLGSAQQLCFHGKRQTAAGADETLRMARIIW